MHTPSRASTTNTAHSVDAARSENAAHTANPADAAPASSAANAMSAANTANAMNAANTANRAKVSNTVDPAGSANTADTANTPLRQALCALLGAPEGHGTEVLAERPDATVVRHGSLVAKAHPPDTAAPGLAARLAAAADPRYAGVLLPPAPGDRTVVRLPGGRLASVWPYGTPVDPDAPDAAPWEAAATLLARLHTTPPPTPPDGLVPRDDLVPPEDLAVPGGLALPPMRGPAKAARALARMRAAPLGSRAHRAAALTVERAWATLPAWCRDEAPPPPGAGVALCHGDFHLGQLVRHPAPDGPWHLIDVDDLGHGDPAWDLARPAAWYAAGLLPPGSWQRFLTAYETAHASARPALPWSPGDPWPRLDAPARALTVQSAALAVAKAGAADRVLDEAEDACVTACARISAVGAPAELPLGQGDPGPGS